MESNHAIETRMAIVAREAVDIGSGYARKYPASNRLQLVARLRCLLHALEIRVVREDFDPESLRSALRTHGTEMVATALRLATWNDAPIASEVEPCP